jgi:hypothetical protein
VLFAKANGEQLSRTVRLSADKLSAAWTLVLKPFVESIATEPSRTRPFLPPPISASSVPILKVQIRLMIFNFYVTGSAVRTSLGTELEIVEGGQRMWIAR